MNVTFRQLRVFAEVTGQGSVQRAAEALHLARVVAVGRGGIVNLVLIDPLRPID